MDTSFFTAVSSWTGRGSRALERFGGGGGVGVAAEKSVREGLTGFGGKGSTGRAYPNVIGDIQLRRIGIKRFVESYENEQKPARKLPRTRTGIRGRKGLAVRVMWIDPVMKSVPGPLILSLKLDRGVDDWRDGIPLLLSHRWILRSEDQRSTSKVQPLSTNLERSALTHQVRFCQDFR
jgi:hypothetical protein